MKAESRDPVIPQVIKWIQQPRDDRRKLEEYLAEVASNYERCFYAARQKEFTLQDNFLYLQVTPTNSQDMVPVFVVPAADRQDNFLYLQVTPTNSQDMAPVFVVPAADRQAAIDGCHRSAGHQGRDCTLSLMKE